MAYPRLLRAAACMGSCNFVLHLESVWTSRLSIFSLINLLPCPWPLLVLCRCLNGGCLARLWCCMSLKLQDLWSTLWMQYVLLPQTVMVAFLRYCAILPCSWNLASLGIVLSLCGIKAVCGIAWATCILMVMILCCGAVVVGWLSILVLVRMMFRAIWIMFSSELVIVWWLAFPSS